MTYQPDLYVRNIGNASPKEVYKVIKQLGFGKVGFVEIEGGNATVAMNVWNMKRTSATRLLLQEGKPLMVYYSQTEFWKVYSYENRFVEEEEQKKQRRIEKQKLNLMKQKELEKQKREQEKQKREQEKQKREQEKQKREEDEEREKQMKMEAEAKKRDTISKLKCIDYGNAAELYPSIMMRRFRK